MVAQEAAQVTILELEKFGEKSELAAFSRFLRQEIGVKVNQVEVLEGRFSEIFSLFIFHGKYFVNCVSMLKFKQKPSKSGWTTRVDDFGESTSKVYSASIRSNETADAARHKYTGFTQWTGRKRRKIKHELFPRRVWHFSQFRQCYQDLICPGKFQ